ncbi:MAG: transcription termination/antitermination protein NusA [Nitrospiraceae bacterium]|nr:transcription termination/antitermination protein NusA [Nitrospiraceae bacterium]
MDQNLKVILQQLEAEKSINRETLLEAIRSAIESAARKGVTHAAHVTVEMDPDTLTFKVFEIREVVEKVSEPMEQIALDEALELNPGVVVGNRLKVPTEPRDFGRIAAQTAKQVIIQKIKDAERESVFEEFRQRTGELVTGVVKRLSHGNVFVAIGKAEALLPHREQSPRENFRPGDRVRAYVLEVDKGPRGAQVILSRATPELVRSLFELEVPEVYDETIEIMGIAREAGNRTKVAVRSNDGNVDAVGACVGMKGSRVRAVVEELSGEKIDIVRWSDDPLELCANALNPADIANMTLDEESRAILVVVPHDQLSLAIGKRGQNARLASRLIGWNIDIRSDEEVVEAPPQAEGGAEESAALEPTSEDAGGAEEGVALEAASEDAGGAEEGVALEPTSEDASGAEEGAAAQEDAVGEAEAGPAQDVSVESPAQPNDAAGPNGDGS